MTSFLQDPVAYAQTHLAHSMGHAQTAIDLLPELRAMPGVGDAYVAAVRAWLEATPSYQGTLTNNALRDAALADDAEAYAAVYLAKVAHGQRALAVAYMQGDMEAAHRTTWAKATDKGVAPGFAHRVLDVLQAKAATSDHVEALIAAGLIQNNHDQGDLFGAHSAQAAEDGPPLAPATKANREAWLNRFMKAARPVFVKAGAPLPENIRISVGFPSAGVRGRAIGECWASEASEDGHFEIFIHPTLDDSARVADVLTHELIHAAVGLAAGHGPKFARVAKALGLEGKMTATVAGPAWKVWAEPILAKLGDIPHGSLQGRASNAPKKQTTRMIKAECTTCGFTFRTTRKWLEGKAELNCPDADCDGSMVWTCEEDPAEGA